jgi:hypothetical protein
VKLKGDVKAYEMKADSGATVTHHFCPGCGSQLYNDTTNNPGMMALVASTLDDPALFSPQVAVYTSSATPWDQPVAGMPHFEKMPPRG